jgi:hypothetical protein
VVRIITTGFERGNKIRITEPVTRGLKCDLLLLKHVLDAKVIFPSEIIKDRYKYYAKDM